MRKYEYETGRFTSIDPLWNKYYGWTPYHYSRNNPINAIDKGGFADFILNGGSVITDGNDDGLLYATPDATIRETFNGNGSFFGELKQYSYQLPTGKPLSNILDNHRSARQGEAGGVGGVDKYFYGGRNDSFNGNATDEVLGALANAKSEGYLKNITYYVHDHPSHDSYGELNNHIRPSEPQDRNALHGLHSREAKNIRFGILFNLQKVNIFGIDKKDDVIFPKSILEDYLQE